ncbi:uncharacterized protein K441DRAFT_658669 [Cenococcum geophilum 1.58]|uniref:uncharacterized protein n=1 Tax=Cenococcum geophilum 1.58 TaxID=794803 RepID=UPI0035901B7C|nr:hypothetical protein K441DRAFT_658669 [Cenococcum geophilum 1.58]
MSQSIALLQENPNRGPGRGDTDGSNDLTSTNTKKSNRNVLLRLYISHTLSTWNSRTFEFGAVIFLAAIFPGTLFYASCYALFRSAAAALLSSWVGGLVDRTHRLALVRQSIVLQRAPVAISCLLFLILLRFESLKALVLICFALSIGLACVEKLASVANTIAVERDWLIVISEGLDIERQGLNSTMRRIDLLCKLVAPIFISLIDGYSTSVAVWVVFGQNAVSVLIEYFAIKQVFEKVPDLAKFKNQAEGNEDSASLLGRPANGASDMEIPQVRLSLIRKALQPWKEYVQNPAFLASFSLSLLYLTVLSTGTQMATYLLTLGFSSIHVSFMRLAAVALELFATCAAPILTKKIGPVRSGLWFINEQLVCVAAAVVLFMSLPVGTKAAGAALIAGVTISRIGLWGFDLCVQFLVQEDAPESSRGRFSAAEMALQNLFELISFATTMVFTRPQDFKYPVLISCGAIGVSAICFATFVRQKRGHLLHASKCFKREKYSEVPQLELDRLPS